MQTTHWITYREAEGREPSVRVNDTENEAVLKRLVDPDEVIAPEDEIELFFQYPPEPHLVLAFQSQGGFTRRQIIDLVGRALRAMYGRDADLPGNEDAAWLTHHTVSEDPWEIGLRQFDALFFEAVHWIGPGQYEVTIGT